ncbi:MAG: PAS domain S-box protein [Dehalococcoidales bacterium]|jgi:PAS domain S-box-containing protein
MENVKTKILLIEDNADDAELIRRTLEISTAGNFEVTVVRSLHEGLALIARKPPDLILTDLGLPDSHGMDTVTNILLDAPHIPLVVLSGFDDEAIAIKAVQSGAQDYLVKGQIESPQLERSLRYSIERARLQGELEQYAQEILNIQANLQKILEKNADAIVVVGENGRILFANPAVETVLNRARQELINQPFKFPLDKNGISEIIVKSRGKNTAIAEMSVVKIHWEGSPAYLASLRDITRRKKMEGDLRASEEKYRNIVELAHDGIVTMDNRGLVTSCNKAFLGLLDTTEKKIIGKHFSRIPGINMAKNPNFLRLFSSMLAGEVTRPLEVEWKRPNGAVTMVEIRCSLMRPNGKVTGIQLFIIDITARKKAEETLRESEEKFSKAFHASVNLFTINRIKDGIFIEVNESFTRITGYTRKEVIGHNADDLNFWVNDTEREKLVKITHEKQRVQNAQIAVRTKSGEIRNGLFSREQIVINGEPCFINAITDVTELAKAQQSLRASEEKFSKTFRNSPEASVISTIEDGKILDANDSFLKLTGYTQQEIIGKKTLELGLWVFPEERESMIKTLQEKGVVSSQEYHFRKKSGELGIWLFSADIVEIDGKQNVLSVATDITERKKMEVKLADEITRRRILIEQSGDGITILDQNGKVYETNRRFAEMIGYSMEETLNLHVWDWDCHLTREEILTLMQNTDEAGNRFETKHRRKDGSSYDAEMSINGAIFAGQKLIFCVCRDITERNRMEESLRFSDTVLKSLHEGVFGMDNNFIITHWNEICERMFGIKVSDAIGKPIGEVLTLIEEYQGQNDKRINTLLDRGFNQEEQIYRTPRGDIWVDVHAQSINDKGQRNGWITLVSDISRRKQAEEDLKCSEEKYRELINTSNDGIISLDPQMKFTLWNRGAEKLFGYKEKEMLGQSALVIFPPATRKNVSREFAQFKQTGKSDFIHRVFESSVMKKDGTVVPVDISISTRNSDGENIITAIIRDITERKTAEEKLRKLDEMKTEFLSNVSHELRTPLQSISGFTKLIMDGQVPDPTTQQEFLQIVDRETAHLGNLINSLLDMSRLEAGRFQIYRKHVPVQGMFTESIKMFRSLAHEKNITLSEDIPPDLPEMDVDNERIRQVIINLLSNAIKFSDPGGSVAIKAEKRDGEVLVQVSDHGTGMNQKTINHLFERFYRAEGETVRGGTGLGLYISKQIVDAHSGRIWVESKTGEGSTFSFTLPINSKGGKKNAKKNTDNRR